MPRWRKLTARLFAIFALLPLGAYGQQFPVVKDHTVIGRIGAGSSSGPSQAIPFSTFLPNLVGSQAANLVFAGPTSGISAAPGFRSLVGADLPAPGASSLGGVQSLNCSTSNWFNTLSTSGVFGCSQPAFSDLTGAITAAQCVAATTSALGCVKPDGSTITISGGVIAAVSGTASSVDAAGATAVTNCGTANAGLYNTSSNKVGCATGQWTLLATLTASSSTSLGDTTHITSSYAEYEIDFESLMPAGTGTAGFLLVHSGGSFQTTGYVTSSFTPNGTAIVTDTPTTFVQLSHGASTFATPGLNGMLRLKNPSIVAVHSITGLIGYTLSGPLTTSYTIAGLWNTSATIDGVQFCFGTTPPTCTTNGIASGTVKIYGRQ